MKRDRLRRRLGALSLALIGIVGISLALVFLLPSHWPADSIFVPRDVSTLMGALAEVGPGGTIVLQAGRGAFHGPVVVSTSGVTIAATGEVLVAGDGGEPAIAIRAEIDRVYRSGDYVGSLVTSGYTGRPTEWVEPQPWVHPYPVPEDEPEPTWSDGTSSRGREGPSLLPETRIRTTEV